MAQTWNDSAHPWQSIDLPWKNQSMPWNNTSLPWKQDGANATLATPTLDLDAASDSGSSSTDNLTNNTTPDLTATFPDGLIESQIVYLEDNGVKINLGGTNQGHDVTALEAAGASIALGLTALSAGSHALRIWYTSDDGADFSDKSVAIVVTIDTTPATLSSATGAAATDTSADLSVSTNKSGGTAYVVVTDSSSPPTSGDIIAETVSGGLFYDSAAVSGTGVQPFTATGLTTAGTRYAHFAQVDAAGNISSVATSSGWAQTGVASVSGEVEIMGTAGGSTRLDGYENFQIWNDLSRSELSPRQSRCTVTSGATGPHGLANAYAFRETSATGTHEFQLDVFQPSSTGNRAIEFVLNPVNRTKFSLYVATNPNTTGCYCNVTLSGAGSVDASGVWGSAFTLGTVTVESLTGRYAGCYRVSMPFTHTSVAAFYPGVAALDGSGASSYAGDNSVDAAIIAGICLYTTGSADSNVKANTRDGSFSTFRHSADYFADLTMDAGIAVTWTEIKIAPMSGQAETNIYLHPAPFAQRERDLLFSFAEVSNDSTFETFTAAGNFGVPSVTHSFPFRNQYHSFPVTGGAGRYIRHVQRYGCVADIRYIANYATGLTAARPVAPTFSRNGGNYPSGTGPTVTLSCRTTSAQIYYVVVNESDTTTIPDNTSTLYTGPFIPALGGVAKRVRAVAYDATGNLAGQYSEVVTSAPYRPWGLKPLEKIYDKNTGLPMYAFAGGSITVGSYIYMYGFSTDIFFDGEGSGGGSIGWPRSWEGMMCYRSPSSTSDADCMMNWELVGNVCPVPYKTDPTQGRWKYFNGHPVYNANTGKYLIIGALSDGSLPDSLNALLGIAEADSPEGPFTFVAQIQPLLSGSPTGIGDIGITTSADNTKCYVCFTTGNQYDSYVSELDSNFHAVAASNIIVSGADAIREAPTLVVAPNGQNKCYHITSGNFPFDSAGAADLKYITCSTSDPMTGTWDAWASAVALSPSGDFTRTQTNGLVRIPGKTDILLRGTQWRIPDGTGPMTDTVNTFIRLRFSGGGVTIGYVDPLTVSDLS